MTTHTISTVDISVISAVFGLLTAIIKWFKTRIKSRYKKEKIEKQQLEKQRPSVILTSVAINPHLSTSSLVEYSTEKKMQRIQLHEANHDKDFFNWAQQINKHPGCVYWTPVKNDWTISVDIHKAENAGENPYIFCDLDTITLRCTKNPITAIKLIGAEIIQYPGAKPIILPVKPESSKFPLPVMQVGDEICLSISFISNHDLAKHCGAAATGSLEILNQAIDFDYNIFYQAKLHLSLKGENNFEYTGALVFGHDDHNVFHAYWEHPDKPN